MGKGTIGLNPFYHDGSILSRSAMAGLLAVIVSFTEARSFVLKDSHWMLYWLVTAMFPQFLITLDEQSEEKAVTVRVGQAVNTVGLAGTRMGISGVSPCDPAVRRVSPFCLKHDHMPSQPPLPLPPKTGRS